MNGLDYVILFGTMLSIAVYGMWKARGQRSLDAYLKGSESTRWGTIGLSVMATQASAITFLSTPGQGYESGIGFVQNYFGMPLALILVAAVFVPIYRRLNVYTAYEFLGHRFDTKTRLLGAGLFLVQRGLAAGLTIYAPAIILSTVLGWPLNATILVSGLLVITYTVSGGSQAVSITQKHQMAVILVGMVAIFVVLLWRMPDGIGFSQMLHVAGTLGKLEAVDFSIDFDKRYTFWSGMLGGVFLSLSYFGTDQSQVQRYLMGRSVRESRLGLMFNAVLKIPMQFFILMLGALVFVFYQFEPPPLFFNQTEWSRIQRSGADESLRPLEQRFAAVHAERQSHIRAWLDARSVNDPVLERAAQARMLASEAQSQQLRGEAKAAMRQVDPNAKTTDTDFVFITFVLRYVPHGLIGLFLAVVFAAALSSTSSELNALGATTSVDYYRQVLHPGGSDAHYVAAARWFTAIWGIVAVGFALLANLAENLIQAVNIVGSIFYGVVLGLFLVAFFLRRVGGTAAFLAALVAQSLVIAGYFTLTISYLWYNLVGCAACVALSLMLQSLLGRRGLAQAR